MTKQNQAVKAKNNKKNLPTDKTIVAKEPANETSSLAQLSGGPVATAGDSTIQAQAARLGDKRLKGAQRRALASHIGRVQGNRHLQRVVASMKQNKQTTTSMHARQPGQAHPIQRVGEASDVAGAVKLAPKGPLAKLQDKLDDPLVNRKLCLELMGQLGSGERELVRKDPKMMRLMTKKFDEKQMLTAVELLDFELKKSIYWINKAGKAGAIGDAGYARLIGSAKSQEVAEMIGWEGVRRVVQQNYKVNPLTFPPLVKDRAMTHHVIGTYVSFSDWVINRAGASAYLRYAGSHDPAATMAGLKTVKRWNTLLSALPRGKQLPTQDRPALLKLFKTATDAASRRRMFEIRFDRKYPGEFDWVAKGEERWTSEEKMLGEQPEAELKAGKGPKNVAEAIKASPKGALEKLRNELAGRPVKDKGACLRYLSQLTTHEMKLVRQDPTMWRQMAGAFNASEMSKALNFIQFPRIGKAVEWLKKAGAHNKIGKQGYELLINNATSQQVAELIGWRDMFNIVKDHSGLDPLALSPLVGNDAMMAHVIKTYPHFSDWVLKHPGAQMYLRYLAMHSPKKTAQALKHASKLPDLLKGLPTGSALAPDDQKAMYTLFTTYADLSDKKSLMKKRFNLQDITKDKAAAPAWDAKGLKRVWQLLELLPPALASDNKWLKRLTRITTSKAKSKYPRHRGVTGGYRVGIGYVTKEMGRREAGGFADKLDQMYGTNVFDGIVIHEMGHAADRQYKFSSLSGPLGTKADLGQWKQYTNMNKLYTAIAAGTNLSALGLKKAELTDTKTALVKALTERKANPQDAFKGLAATWTPANKWRKLWNKVKGHAIVRAIQQGHMGKEPWDKKIPAVVGGRYYHEAYKGKWVSYLTGARAGGKLSRYQFRDHGEFFAEMYATYYLTPNNPGTLVKKWNPGAYRWFRATVDAGFTTRVKK